MSMLPAQCKQPHEDSAPFGYSCTSDAGCVVNMLGALRAEDGLIRTNHSALL